MAGQRLLLALFLLFAGCRAKQPATVVRLASQTKSAAVQYAGLPGLRSSPHEGLRAELAQLQSERATPEQLDADLAAQRRERAATDGASPQQALAEAFPQISRGLLRGQLDAAEGNGPTKLSPVQLERARELLARFAESRQKFHAALPPAGAGFGVSTADGILADLEFLEPLALGCRLENLAAAEALADGRPDDALPPLEILLRTAQVLADECNVTTRITAASLRAESLEVLQAIAAHAQATRKTHERLLQLLTRYTEGWPDDARAWIGERAGGVVAYELVRDGQFLALLSREEVERLEAQQTLTVTARAALRGVDRDELYYLQTLRKMIAACSQPHFQRREMLAIVRRELADREQSADYPLVAARVLLTDFEAAHERQAVDAARCQAWLIALSAAVERPLQTGIISPVTGQPLVVESSPAIIRVRGILSGGDSFEIPIRRP